jgi:hypothetical protein
MLFLASFTEYLGDGGATRLAEATGVTQHTISSGKKVLKGSDISTPNIGKQRVRAEGCGRKSIVEKNPKIVQMLEGLLEGNTV